MGAAGHVYGNRFVLRRELQFVEQVSADETHRVIEVQAGFSQVLNQAQGTGAGVAVDRIKPATAGMQQGVDQLLALVFGLFGITLGGEGLAAAQVVLILRKDYLIARLFQ
ncbi:hypothetical protein D3C85_1436200 [compost metagenome]